MSNFKIKTVPLELVDLPPVYSLWDLSKKAGKTLGPAIFHYYKTSDPTIFDKKETKRNLYDTRKWYYYYKLETILVLSKKWYQEQSWKSPIIIENSYIDPRGKQRYVVHDGRHRFSVLRSYKVEKHDFLFVNDRKSVTEASLEEIKKFYKDDVKDSVAIYTNKKDGMPLIQPKNLDLTEHSYPMVKSWIKSKLNFWDFVRS